MAGIYGDTRTAKQRIGKKSKVLGFAKAMTKALKKKSSIRIDDEKEASSPRKEEKEIETEEKEVRRDKKE